MNISKLIEANKKIAGLKAQLAQHDEEIKNIEDMNQAIADLADVRINKLVDENNGLRAQVNALKDGVTHFNKTHGDLNQLLEAYVHTPRQCLASVKADAVKAFGHQIGLYDAAYDDQEYIEVSRDSLRDHIEQLRES